jgi:hypothetical protein
VAWSASGATPCGSSTEELRNFRSSLDPDVPNFLAPQRFSAYILKRSWMLTEVAGLNGGRGFARLRR